MTDPYKILKERREIEMREAEFTKLMKEWEDEIELIAGQPDPTPVEQFAPIDEENAKRKAEGKSYEFTWGKGYTMKAGPRPRDNELTYAEIKKARKTAVEEFSIDLNGRDLSMAQSGGKRNSHNRMLLEKEKEKKEMVNQPSHYQVADTNVNDMLAKLLTHSELMGWLKGNIIKYRMRAFKKEEVGMQDIKKSNWYQKFYDEYTKKNTP